MVAFAFSGPPPHTADEVNHKDGVKKNNSRANLEWATSLTNRRHAGRAGLLAHGERHWAAKLTPADIRTIRRLRGTMSQRAIAAQFGVCHSAIWLIYQGRNWAHIT